MVDVTFDCRKDAKGRDPDSHSPTLRRYHQLLWSKPLPSGKLFGLDILGPKPFLVHQSELGEFHLTSDSITHSYSSRAKIKPLVQHLPDTQRSFAESGAWFVSECILFPGKRVNGKSTINGARGMNRQIGDRFDLTLECIRRHYSRGESPLSTVLDRHSTFFALFVDFKGYVDFFLLQDLVGADFKAVKFYLPFDDFRGDPLPHDVESYELYLRGVMSFSIGRAQRILKWCSNAPYSLTVNNR
jgi:hypothetical protein